jgi:hypothetical protein
MTAEHLVLAERIADAVLYEGYVLYPYRASALKNRFRWQFGVIAPRSADAGVGADQCYAKSECLVEAGARARLTVKLRFLQVQVRTIEAVVDAARGTWRACERLVVDDRELVTWEEAVPHEVSQAGLLLENLGAERTFAFEVSGGTEMEVVRDASGSTAARIARERQPLAFTLVVGARACGDFLRITLRVENTATSSSFDRILAMRRALLGCHALVAVEDGAFISALAPPDHAVDAVKSCESDHWWPVLVGSNGARDVVLFAPIILYDYPAVAPESTGDFFDATEIDELLTLRVLTLTDDEKREIAATDERARRILERVEHTTSNTLDGLHGAIRQLREVAEEPSVPSWEAFLNPPNQPSPEEASVTVGSAMVRRGSRVRLAPRPGADAMDMFLGGRVATVVAVHRDLEDKSYLAVTLDDDPAADLHRELGRFFYFSPAEVVPLEAETGAHADG